MRSSSPPLLKTQPQLLFPFSFLSPVAPRASQAQTTSECMDYPEPSCPSLSSLWHDPHCHSSDASYPPQGFLFPLLLPSVLSKLLGMIPWSFSLCQEAMPLHLLLQVFSLSRAHLTPLVMKLTPFHHKTDKKDPSKAKIMLALAGYLLPTHLFGVSSFSQCMPCVWHPKLSEYKDYVLQGVCALLSTKALL